MKNIKQKNFTATINAFPIITYSFIYSIIDTLDDTVAAQLQNTIQPINKIKKHTNIKYGSINNN